MIRGWVSSRCDELAKARAGPFLGLVHGVVDEVLLDGVEPVRTLAALLREFTEELGSLVLLDDIRLAVENQILMIPDLSEEDFPKSGLKVSHFLFGMVARVLDHRGEPFLREKAAEEEIVAQSALGRNRLLD